MYNANKQHNHTAKVQKEGGSGRGTGGWQCVCVCAFFWKEGGGGGGDFTKLKPSIIQTYQVCHIFDHNILQKCHRFRKGLVLEDHSITNSWVRDPNKYINDLQVHKYCLPDVRASQLILLAAHGALYKTVQFFNSSLKLKTQLPNVTELQQPRVAFINEVWHVNSENYM